MATISGVNTRAAIGISESADTWGTAEAVDERIVFESLTFNENVNTLMTSGIGSGGQFSDNAKRGAVSVSGSLTMKAGFDNGFTKLMAAFMGASSGSEQTSSQGDYLHVITSNATAAAYWITLAVESSSTTVLEFPSMAITGVTLNFKPMDYVEATFDFIADRLVTTSPTNNNAAIGATTVTDSEYACYMDSDEFLINAQASGALTTSTHRLNTTGVVFTLQKNLEFIIEAKGSSGNGTPVFSDKATGRVSVALKANADNTYWTAAQAATEYKCSTKAEGTQIGSGDNKKIEALIPRMILIETPDMSLSSPGTNPVTLNFEILEAASNPTGMSDTTPYIEVTNEQSSDYTA